MTAAGPLEGLAEPSHLQGGIAQTPVIQCLRRAYRLRRRAHTDDGATSTVGRDMRKHIPPGLRSERGQSFAEFTLILPIALFLILGVIDLGKAISYWLDSGHLANEGARYAVVQGCPQGCSTSSPTYPTDLLQAIVDNSETPQLRSNATLCLKDLSSDSWAVGDELRLTVTSNYNFIPFLHIASTARSIRGRSDMRLEKTWTIAPPGNPYGVGPAATSCDSISTAS
jgi:TadE-like protein